MQLELIAIADAIYTERELRFRHPRLQVLFQHDASAGRLAASLGRSADPLFAAAAPVAS